MTARGKIGAFVRAARHVFFRALPAAALGAALYGLLFRSSLVLETGRQAILVCTGLLIPSLFPFFVVSNLLISTGCAQMAGRFFSPVMKGLFGVNGRCAAAFILGIVGGYPVGAKTAIALYREGACTKTEAERLLGFCNNCGPAFILGAVGTAVFSSARTGLVLYGIHILSSVTIGIGFRFYRNREPDPVRARVRSSSASRVPLSAQFTRGVLDAGSGVLRISAFVVVFAVAISLLFSTGAMETLAKWLGALLSPLGLGTAQARLLLQGFLEVTSGLLSLSAIEGSLTARLALAACMLGWAGLCVHCQVLSFIEGSGLSLRPYLLGKLAHGILSALYAALFARLFPASLETASILHRQLDLLSAAGFTGSLLSGCAGALAVAWLFVVFWTRETANGCILDRFPRIFRS